MPSSSALLAAAAAYLDALASYERARILAVLSEDYEHTLAPASIGVESPISRDAFVPMACNLQAVISRFSFRIKQAWPNEAEGRVTVWAEGEGDLRPHIKQSSGEDYSLKREYMFVLEMDSSGEKVEKALEFVDTKLTEAMMGLLGKEFPGSDANASKSGLRATSPS
ncbi:hypothetical protein ACJZ2D_008321 [Fusarium nematophilum]